MRTPVAKGEDTEINKEGDPLIVSNKLSQSAGVVAGRRQIKSIGSLERSISACENRIV